MMTNIGKKDMSSPTPNKPANTRADNTWLVNRIKIRSANIKSIEEIFPGEDILDVLLRHDLTVEDLSKAGVMGKIRMKTRQDNLDKIMRGDG